MKLKHGKKRRLKPAGIVLIVVLVLLLVVGAVFGAMTLLKRDTVPAGPVDTESSVSSEESSEPIPEPTSARLIGFGDGLIHVSVF